MKTAATQLDFLGSGEVLVQNAGATFGLGWVGALVVLSGGPVIATGLTLVAAASITEVQGFTMMTGARLGAAFVVLVVAVIYALRGGSGHRYKPVSTAIIALSTTAVTYTPAAVVGLFLLRFPAFQEIIVSSPRQFTNLVDAVYGGLLDYIGAWPPLLVFVGGLALLVLSFRFVDAVIPDLSGESLGRRWGAWLTQKWPMFILGCLVAIVTMSVSVALTLLVPLVAKKGVRREHIVPYIMGANIGTLGDSLFLALALDSPGAVRIVVAGIITTAAMSVLILAFFYARLNSLIFEIQARVMRTRKRVAAFTASLFLVPLVIVIFSIAVA